MTIKSRSTRDTAAAAATLAGEVLKYKKGGGAFVVGLIGNLGSGKTIFVQGFGKGMGLKRRITSPTFLITRSYRLRNGRYEFLHHIDAYRIGKTKDLEVLGIKEILREPKNIVLIEWADKIGKILPKKSLLINFRHGRRPNERTLILKPKK